jgi:hypothetical protein
MRVVLVDILGNPQLYYLTERPGADKESHTTEGQGQSSMTEYRSEVE